MTIRAVIVDDEPPAREGIRLRLAEHEDMVVVAEFGSAREAKKLIATDPPDLLFLDVQMPGMSGIEMLQTLGPDSVPAVILVTAFEEHALDAFEVSVVDYILKPIDPKRFEIALDRARTRLERVRAVELSGRIKHLIEGVDPSLDSPGDRRGGASDFISRFLVEDGNAERPVSVEDIDWIEAAGDYVRLHEGSSYSLVRTSMNRLEQDLDPRLFGRAHRSAIVRFDRIREIRSIQHGDAEIHLTTGAVVRLSRSYRERFKRGLSKTAPPDIADQTR